MKHWIFISCFFSLFLPTIKAQNNATSGESPNQAFLKNFPNKHITEWRRGMKFMLSPNPELIVTLYPYQMDGNPVHRLHPVRFGGKIFEVDTIEKRLERCEKGECVRSCIIFTCEGQKYEHGMSGTLEELRLKEKHYDTYINGLMYMNDIETVKSMLERRIIWVTSNEWQAVGMSYYMGALKYVPVIVTKVTEGTHLAPVRIFFRAEGKAEAYMDVCMSNTNVYDPKSTVSPHFLDCFTIENPYSKQKNVSLYDWGKIQQGEVTEGMPKIAAEFSWGKPQRIEKSDRGGHAMEEWHYGNGHVLIFEDEILIKYKK